MPEPILSGIQDSKSYLGQDAILIYIFLFFLINGAI